MNYRWEFVKCGELGGDKKTGQWILPVPFWLDIRQFELFIRSFVGSYDGAGGTVAAPYRASIGVGGCRHPAQSNPFGKGHGLLRASQQWKQAWGCLLQRTEGTTFQERTDHLSLPFLPGLSEPSSTPAQASPSLHRSSAEPRRWRWPAKVGTQKPPSPCRSRGRSQLSRGHLCPAVLFPYCRSSGEHGGGLSKSRPPAGTRRPGTSLSSGGPAPAQTPACQVGLELLKQAPV